jgi:hypothetical protein
MVIPMQILREVLLVLAITSLTSCVIFPTPMGEFYKPTYAGSNATYEGRDCQGQFGPKSVIKLQASESVIVTVRLDDWEHIENIILEIELYIIEGTTVQFETNQLVFWDPRRGDEWMVEATDIFIFSWAKSSSGKTDFRSPIVGGKDFRGLSQAKFKQDITDDKSHEEIIFQMPNILVNGERISFKPITFKKTKGGVEFLVPFNC